MSIVSKTVLEICCSANKTIGKNLLKILKHKKTDVFLNVFDVFFKILELSFI